MSGNGHVIEPFNEKEYEILEEYRLTEFTKIVIARNLISGATKYFVLEEKLNRKERELIKEVMNRLRYLVIKSEDYDIEKLIKRELMKVCKDKKVRQKLFYYIRRDYLGYGPIHALILDPNLEDISCNGVGVPIYVWHRKYESIETNIVIKDLEYLKSYIRSLAAKCGKHISSAFPVLDATLPDTGYRLAATLEDISSRGPTFTIRKFRERPFTITELIADGVIDPLIAAFFWVMIENKRTFMIFGATGSGKTTLLNALLTFIHPSMKICTVEETREINIPSKNWVPFVTRETYAIGERVGEVSLYDLVKVTLRYRPDYIIVGEVRGEEAYVLFQAMQSGHGGISTIHAENLESMMNRLLNPPMNIPPQLIPTLNFALHISRVKISNRVARRVLSVWEIHSVDSFYKLAEWDPVNDTFIHYLNKSEVLERVAEQLGQSKEELWEEVERRAELLDYLARNKIVEYNEIVKWVYSYYRDPHATLRSIGVHIPKISVRALTELDKVIAVSQEEEELKGNMSEEERRALVSKVRREIARRLRVER